MGDLGEGWGVITGAWGGLVRCSMQGASVALSTALLAEAMHPQVHLEAAVGVDVHGGEEAGLGGVRVDPA